MIARLIIALVGLVGLSAVYGELLSGTAATVNKQLITVQDARFYRTLQRFKGGETNLFERESGEPLLRTVQRIALEEMVTAEIKSFQFKGTGFKDAEAAVSQLKNKGKTASWKAILKEYGKSEKVALAILGRAMEVDQFLQKKVETLTPIITDDEAEKYYRQNQTKFLGTSFEAAKSDIVAELRKERMQQGLEEWIRSLREKYGMTILLKTS